MKQSKLNSFIEVCFNISIGWLLSIFIYIAIFPLFNIHTNLITNSVLATIFSIVSIARGYFIRRLFNKFKIQSKITSLTEVFINTTLGFLISLIVQILVYPLFNINLNVSINMILCLIFTLVSIARGFIIRRWFNQMLIQASQNTGNFLSKILVR